MLEWLRRKGVTLRVENGVLLAANGWRLSEKEKEAVAHHKTILMAVCGELVKSVCEATQGMVVDVYTEDDERGVKQLQKATGIGPC